MQKNIIFMVAVKNDDKPGRTDAYSYSVDSWKRWGEKHNSEVVVLDEPLVDPKEMSFTWQRYYLFDLLENSEIEFDQVLMVDSDTIVHPDCPDFFAMSDRKYCGVHNEGSYDWLFRSMENYSKYLFNDFTFDFTRYINGGFQILNKTHKDFFSNVVQFYQENKKTILWMQNAFHVGTDQPAINFLLNMYNIDYKVLPYEFNMQDLVLHEGLTEDLLFWKFGYVAHFNAIPNNHQSTLSNQWMKYTYEKLYGELK